MWKAVQKKRQNYSSQKFMSLSLETHFRSVEYIFHNFDFEQNTAKNHPNWVLYFVPEWGNFLV